MVGDGCSCSVGCHEEVSLSVRAVLRRRDGKILLLQRSLDGVKSNPGKWEIPGGLTEFLEDVIPALKREVKEETGLIIYPSSTRPLTFVSVVSGTGRHIAHVFLCERFRRSRGLEGDITLSEEHQDSRWATVEEALDLSLVPTTREVLEFLLE
ncbi:MAG: NUDIX hydrolase [Patescibacteria group bacterium]|nr:MAG: NUDIX hydrolase [Patescibacteria group bacterium]